MTTARFAPRTFAMPAAPQATGLPGGVPKQRRATVVVCGLVAAWLAMGFALAMAAGPATAGIGDGLRLLMVDDDGCVYCRKWDAEVGGFYEESAVGRIVPLERRKKRHQDLGPYEPLAYTPTFVLVRDGAEVGRIVGYPGPEMFWAELQRLMVKAGPATSPGPSPSPRGPHDGPRPNPRDAALPPPPVPFNRVAAR